MALAEARVSLRLTNRRSVSMPSITVKICGDGGTVFYQSVQAGGFWRRCRQLPQPAVFWRCRTLGEEKPKRQKAQRGAEAPL
jgi:hypothetical protein